jgi:hypothetical protein
MNKVIYHVILSLGIMPYVAIAMDASKKELGLPRTKSRPQRTSSLNRNFSLLAPIPEDPILESKKNVRQLARSSRGNETRGNEAALGKETISAERLLLKAKRLDDSAEGKIRCRLGLPIADKIAFDNSIKDGEVPKIIGLLENNNRLIENYPLAKNLYAVWAGQSAWLGISSSDVAFLPAKSICEAAVSLAKAGNNRKFLKHYADVVKKDSKMREFVNCVDLIRIKA